MINECTVFFHLCVRVITRVYNNDLNNVEIRRTDTEKTAIKLMRDLYRPDIVITGVKLKPGTFSRAYTLYPLTRSGFDQDKLCFEMQDRLASKGERKVCEGVLNVYEA